MMSRHDRAQYFESLCDLRAAYASAGDDDRRPAISIDDVTLWAEAILEAYAAQDATLVVPEPPEQPSLIDPRD